MRTVPFLPFVALPVLWPASVPGRPARRQALLRACVVAAWLAAGVATAAPAPWYYWRSRVDGARVCAQTSPGPGWERDSDAYDGPGCQPRRRVLIVPMR